MTPRNLAGFTGAVAAYNDHEKAIPEKLREIQNALTNRQNAYAKAAEAAGEKAGGGEKGERVRAAIEAIPRVQTVVGRVDAVVASISPPPYSDPAGRAFGAAVSNSIKNFDSGAFLLYWAG